jgi:hypothetical protein
VIGGVVVLAAGFIAYQVWASRPKFRMDLPNSYYTVDDGKTFFVANSSNIAPFDYKGKTAVAAYVFECGGERFVGYLERYLPDARQAILEGRGTPQHQIQGRELKRPGDATWVKSGDFSAVAKVTEVVCPHGGAHAPEPVEPR